MFADLQLVGSFGVGEQRQDNYDRGVTWMENKIYVVGRGSNRVHVFRDQEPFDELNEEEIKIKGMKRPRDVSASKTSRSIFISDHGDRCLWKVQMPGGKISRCRMDGTPRSISITSSDELIVVQQHGDRWSLDIFSCSDGTGTRSIALSTRIERVMHAVQSLNGNIIISHSTKKFPDVYQICEMSIDGRNFIRTFDPRLVHSMNLLNWLPYHLAFDDDGHLFVADWGSDRIYLLSSQLTDPQILSKNYENLLEGPHRLCYIREKQQLIVGQTGGEGDPGFVSVFNVRPR